MTRISVILFVITASALLSGCAAKITYVHHPSIYEERGRPDWTYDENRIKEDLKNRLNRELGAKTVKSVKFKLGAWQDEKQAEREKAARDETRNKQEIDPDPETIEEAKKAVSVIPDHALREQVFRTLMAWAKRENSEDKEG